MYVGQTSVSLGEGLMYTNISCDCVSWRSFLVAEWPWSLYHVYWHYNPVTEIQVQRPADMKSYGNEVPPQEWVERRVISPWVGHVCILSTSWRTEERRLFIARDRTGISSWSSTHVYFIYSDRSTCVFLYHKQTNDNMPPTQHFNALSHDAACFSLQ